MRLPPLTGVAIRWPDGREAVFGDLDPGAFLRVASISKVLTGQVVLAAGIGRETVLSDVLGWRLAHPDHPDSPVTAGMVAAHCAGLSDAGGYLLPRDASLRDWCARASTWAHAPGQVLSYCNLGSHILAEAAERATGRRFGDLAADWLAAQGIPGGFNWWGVSTEDRTRAMPGLRPGPGGLTPEVDADVPPEGFVAPDGHPDKPPDPGQAAWLWSPQGGLRTTLRGCLRLAHAIGAMDATPIWRNGQGLVDGPASVYQGWGFGLQLLETAPHWQRPLAGHFADAHGIRGGIWRDPSHGLCFAVLMNGVPDLTGPDYDDFTPEERAIFRTIAEKAL